MARPQMFQDWESDYRVRFPYKGDFKIDGIKPTTMKRLVGAIWTLGGGDEPENWTIYATFKQSGKDVPFMMVSTPKSTTFALRAKSTHKIEWKVSLPEKLSGVSRRKAIITLREKLMNVAMFAK